MTVSAVDLFCGVGGLTHGLQQSEMIDVKVGIDIDSDCEYPYISNNQSVEFMPKDITTEIQIADIVDYLPSEAEEELSLIAGCAPCQPFSSLSNGNEKNRSDHDKWGLLYEFAEIIETINPDLVTMENVPQVKGSKPYNEFRETLQNLGYSVWYDVVYCPEYGVPQKRKRLVLLASKLGHIELIEPTHKDYVTLADEFGKYDLCELAAGESDQDDPLHVCRGLSKKNLERIRHSVPGGTWEDWPNRLKLKCHLKDSGRKYKAPYGRMEWDELAPTMTTQFYNYGSGRFGHPEQDRALSLREAAILQTFPGTYSFIENEEEVSMKSLGRLIGNAVPVRLAQAIGQSIEQHVANTDPQRRLSVHQ